MKPTNWGWFKFRYTVDTSWMPALVGKMPSGTMFYTPFNGSGGLLEETTDDQWGEEIDIDGPNPDKYSGVRLRMIHGYSSRHEDLIRKSDQVGCFYCLKVFDSHLIQEWGCDLDAHGAVKRTAICPYCSIDSVLPESDEYELSDGLLTVMYQEYFGM